jgi:hypothetical protein
MQTLIQYITKLVSPAIALSSSKVWPAVNYGNQNITAPVSEACNEPAAEGYRE